MTFEAESTIAMLGPELTGTNRRFDFAPTQMSDDDIGAVGA